MVNTSLEKIYSDVSKITVNNNHKKKVFVPLTDTLILNLKGFYDVNSTLQQFDGKIKFSTCNGSFNGKMYDLFPTSLEQSVFGFFYNEENKTKLVFLKFNTENITLHVTERVTTPDLCGVYLGKIYPIYSPLTFDIINRLLTFKSFIPTIGAMEQEAVLLGLGDYGQINIFNK